MSPDALYPKGMDGRNYWWADHAKDCRAGLDGRTCSCDVHLRHGPQSGLLRKSDRPTREGNGNG